MGNLEVASPAPPGVPVLGVFNRFCVCEVLGFPGEFDSTGAPLRGIDEVKQ